MLSKTSDASTSLSKESRRFSNVLVRIVSGLFPVNVCGSRVTRDIKGYGTYPSRETTTSGAIYQFGGHHVGDSGQTHPHLVHFIVLIPEDQVVRSEMEGADVGPIQLGTNDPLDLFRNSRRNENSDRPQDHGPRVRIEANLCDSNFVHVGADWCSKRAGVPRVRRLPESLARPLGHSVYSTFTRHTRAGL